MAHGMTQRELNASVSSAQLPNSFVPPFSSRLRTPPSCVSIRRRSGLCFALGAFAVPQNRSSGRAQSPRARLKRGIGFLFVSTKETNDGEIFREHKHRPAIAPSHIKNKIK